MKNLFEKTITFYKKHNLIINSAILLLGSVLSLVAEIFGYFVFAIFVAIVIFSRDEAGFYYLAIMSAFACSIGIMGEGMIVYYCMCCAYFLILLIKNLIKKSLAVTTPALCLFIALIVYMLLPIKEYNLRKFINIGFVLIPLSACYFMYLYRKNLDFYKLTKLAFFSLLIAFGVSSFSGLLPLGLEYIAVWPFKFGVRYGALFGNVNHLSEFCIILASIFACFLFKRKQKLGTLIMFVVTLGLGIFTLSKAYMVLCFLLVGLMVVAALAHGYHKQYKVVFGIAMSIGIVIVVICGFEFIRRLGSLSNLFNLQELTTNRSLIWLRCLEDLAATPLTLIFGCGMVYTLHGVFHYPSTHNLYLEYATKLGLVGTGILIALIVLMFKSASASVSSETKHTRFEKWIPLIVCCSYFFVESMVYNMACFFLLPLVFVLPFIIGEQTGELEGATAGAQTDANIKSAGVTTEANEEAAEIDRGNASEN